MLSKAAQRSGRPRMDPSPTSHPSLFLDYHGRSVPIWYSALIQKQIQISTSSRVFWSLRMATFSTIFPKASGRQVRNYPIWYSLLGRSSREEDSQPAISLKDEFTTAWTLQLMISWGDIDQLKDMDLMHRWSHWPLSGSYLLSQGRQAWFFYEILSRLHVSYHFLTEQSEWERAKKLMNLISGLPLYIILCPSPPGSHLPSMPWYLEQMGAPFGTQPPGHNSFLW